jgi:hypothetical protein
MVVNSTKESQTMPKLLQIAPAGQKYSIGDLLEWEDSFNVDVDLEDPGKTQGKMSGPVNPDHTKNGRRRVSYL